MSVQRMVPGPSAMMTAGLGGPVVPSALSWARTRPSRSWAAHEHQDEPAGPESGPRPARADFQNATIPSPPAASGTVTEPTGVSEPPGPTANSSTIPAAPART